jgi:hypothetical protein
MAPDQSCREGIGRRQLAARRPRRDLRPRLPIGLGGVWIEAHGVVSPRAGSRPRPSRRRRGPSPGPEPDSGLSAAILGDRMFTTLGVYTYHPFAKIADAVPQVAGC